MEEGTVRNPGINLVYRYASPDDLDFLVQMRIRDLALFSDHGTGEVTVQNIRRFYDDGIRGEQCFTLLGFDGEYAAATATIYYYRILPSNENPQGIVGQITNVWVDEAYRKQGIAAYMVTRLMESARGRAGMLCLNSSGAAMGLYRFLGFRPKGNYLVYDMDGIL